MNEKPMHEQIEDIRKRADREIEALGRVNYAKQWLRQHGLVQDGMRISAFIRKEVHLEYKATDLLGIFWLFSKFAQFPDAFVPEYCATKEKGRWEFPLETYTEKRLLKEYDDLKDASEEGVYKIYPLWFELRESHNERGMKRAYCTRRAGFDARFKFRFFDEDIDHFNVKIHCDNWEVLTELALSHKGWYYKAAPGYAHKPDAPRSWRYETVYGKDVYLHPQIGSWEEVYYSGGYSYLFIPEGFVWANGFGWEQELVNYELERR